MAVVLSPLQEAFNSFLLTMPVEPLEELLRCLKEAKAAENNNNAENGSAAKGPSLDAGYRPALSTPASRFPASHGKVSREGKRRPLNSFIAFRSFYSNMFPDLTQRAKSGLLRFLWQNDPCKTEWAILAKAYSRIRDDHVNEVSLDSFLFLNTGFLGINEPSRYLEAMGWELHIDGQNQYTMTRAMRPTSTTEAGMSNKYSVDDIVSRCYEMGYVSENRRVDSPRQNNDFPVMAFPAQPTPIQVSRDNATVNYDCSAESDVETSPAESIADSPSPFPNDMSTTTHDAYSHVHRVLSVEYRPGLQQIFNNGLEARSQSSNADETGCCLPIDSTSQTPLFNYDPFAMQSFEGY